jgi:hypothetical protein
LKFFVSRKKADLILGWDDERNHRCSVAAKYRGQCEKGADILVTGHDGKKGYTCGSETVSEIQSKRLKFFMLHTR